MSANGALHEYADSQFGHIFAMGADRDEARKSMVMALKELSIRSDFRTTIEYLVTLLEYDAFVTSSNAFCTAAKSRRVTRCARSFLSTLFTTMSGTTLRRIRVLLRC